MLRHLLIENYALIDRLDLELHPGLNLLTGETGSGKSIVVDAVELLLGAKGSSDVIRAGADRARIIATFSPPPKASAHGNNRWKKLAAVLDESGLDLPDGEELILQRDIYAAQAGQSAVATKSRLFVNNQPATVGLFRSIAPFLAEIHGQNEQQELLLPAAQLEMLDRFGGAAPAASRVENAFELWTESRTRRETFQKQRQEWARQKDLWQFQSREIEQAGLGPGQSAGESAREDERLEQEKQLLAHSDRVQSGLAQAYDLLYESSHSATGSLSAARKRLDEISRFDPALEKVAGTLAEASAQVEDAALTLRDSLSRLEASPGRLEEVENRLALLDRLKRKYGPTLQDVIQHGERVRAQLQEAESGEEMGAALDHQVEETAAAYREAAKDLSARRAKAALELKQAVEKELRALAMTGTIFEARLVPLEPEAWRSSGTETVEFLISPNPGEPLRPLARIASGGELSRLMLALETAADAKQGDGNADRTLVFDEVDSGIGGRAAEMVGRKLRQLAERRQVLCVTHLPQIASFAHHHFRVEKLEQKGRTVTRVEHLQESERAQELARMLSGSQITEAVLQHAEQLLKANR